MNIYEIINNMPPGLILSVKNPSECDINGLYLDSRQVKPGGVFFCLIGKNNDFHDFAGDAVANGAQVLVVQRELPIDVMQIIVTHSREAMALFSSAFYNHPSKQLKIIGITGTKGKTTTSYMVKSIAECAGYKVGVIGSIGCMIGSEHIPLSMTTPEAIEIHALLRKMADAGVDIAVMEVSAHATHFKRLAGLRFDMSAFINFSHDHLDLFSTMDEYAHAKQVFFNPEYNAFAVANADDAKTQYMLADMRGNYDYFGIDSRRGAYADDIKITDSGTQYILHSALFSKPLEINLIMSGRFNVYNSMCAAMICRHMGMPGRSIKQGLAALHGVPGRMEFLHTDTPYRVIVDFAHAPDPLENVLTTIKGFIRGRLITVFGCGGDRDTAKRSVMGEIAGRLSDMCIITSDNPRTENPLDIIYQIESGIKNTKSDYVIIENRRSAISHALDIAREGDIIILAGKGHETYQEINGIKYPFDEKTVVSELLQEKAKNTAK